MTQTNITNVKELLGDYSGNFADAVITNFIGYAYTILQDYTQNTATGNKEEILHRYLTAHLLLKQKALSGLGKDISSVSAGSFTYKVDANSYEASQADFLWKEFVELSRTLCSSSVYLKEQEDVDEDEDEDD